jgi:dolichol-phosphate mannosyltransferase
MALLEKIDVGSVLSQGYCFQVDLTRRAHGEGFRVVEVPITFTERERGASKMSAGIVREALWRVTVWGLRARRDAVLRLLRRGAGDAAGKTAGEKAGAPSAAGTPDRAPRP